jgi:hypothetical protein
MYWIIYILGYLVSYICLKLLFQIDDDEPEWGDIAIRLFCSLLSWITVLLMLIAFLIVRCNESIHIKPPKWL